MLGNMVWLKASKVCAALCACSLVATLLTPFGAFANDDLAPQSGDVTVTFKGTSISYTIPAGSTLSAAQIPGGSNTSFPISSGVAKGETMPAVFEGWINGFNYTDDLSAVPEDQWGPTERGRFSEGIAFRKDHVPRNLLLTPTTTIGRNITFIKAFSISAYTYQVQVRENSNPVVDASGKTKWTTETILFEKHLVRKDYTIYPDKAQEYITKALSQKKHQYSAWDNKWVCTGEGVNASNPFPLTVKNTSGADIAVTMTADLYDYGKPTAPDPTPTPTPTPTPDPTPTEPENPADVAFKDVNVEGVQGILARIDTTGSAAASATTLKVAAKEGNLPEEFDAKGTTIKSVYDINLFADGADMHTDFGKLELSFPVNYKDGAALRLFHSHQDGTVTSEVVNAKGGYVTIRVTDLSTFAIGEEPGNILKAVLPQTGDLLVVLAPLTFVLGSLAMIFALCAGRLRLTRKPSATA